jgi:NAD(P)-dependent dehydrogenase (short-subunit alcohol dehydrogenase family)
LNRTVIITGATRGIGFEAALALARLGERVSIVGRDRDRLSRAVAAIREQTGAAVGQYLGDLSVQADVRRLAAELAADHPQIHALINNAGGVHARRLVSTDGVELTLATNHLGSFLLTTLLVDRLVSSAPSRVVTVASIGHRKGTLDFDDLGLARGYTIMKAYRRSKLANVLFANELARRLAGTGVTSNSVHPGTVATNIWSGAPWWSKPYITLFWRPHFIAPDDGARPLVRLAVDPALDAVTGRYFEDGGFVDPAPAALDENLARRLWQVSEALTTRR